MTISDDDLMGTFEQKKACVAGFNLMDDIFFSVVMRSNAAAEYLLTRLLGKPVKIIENKTQYSIRNIEDHSVVMDALIEDDEHNIYDVEVQIGDKDNHERRLRYYRTAIDWSYLEKGRDFSELPEVYMIFISDFDPFDMNKIHYEIVQYVETTTRKYDNGVHIHYFNTRADEETDLTELMRFFANSSAGSKSFGALSEQVNYHKIQNEGVDIMCDYVREYGDTRESKGRLEGRIEGKIKMINSLLRDGIPLEKALKYADFDRETYEKYSANKQ